jgi:hypothetical protein
MQIRKFTANAHWRDSAREAKLWIFDSSTVFPLIIFFFDISWVTFIISMIVVCFFIVLRHYGFSSWVFLRWLRAFVAGKRKLATPWWM